MPRNASTGVYSAPASSFNPAVTGNSAQPTDWNALLSDLATALAHSPSSTRALYATTGQVQDAAVSWGGVAGGTADALSLVLSPPITAYATGFPVRFVTGAAANTGPATLAINLLPAQPLRKADGTALAAGDLPASTVIIAVYDGSVFRAIVAERFTGGGVASPIEFPTGSPGAPSMTFAGDTNTGIYRAAADVLSVATNGAQRARFENAQATVFTPLEVQGAVNTTTGDVIVDRVDSVSEGGRVILRRASDNGNSYQLQAFGSGSNPTFRIVRTHGTPASVFSMTDTGAITVSDFLTLNADPTSALHAATKDYVDNAVATGASVAVVASQVVTSATAQVDLAIPSTGAVFELLLADVLPSANAELRMRTSIDGVTFASGASDYFHPTLGNSSFMSLTNGDSVSSTETGRTYVAGGVIYPGVASTGRFGFVANSSFISTSSSNNIGSIGGWRNAVGRQQAIRIYFATGNILRGVFRLVRVA